MKIEKHIFLRIFGLFLIWRLLLLGLGFFADILIPYQPTFPYYDIVLPSYQVPRWLYSWANFDGVHYLTIAEKGYVGTGLIQAFFPLLPFVLLFSLHVVTGLNTLMLGLLVTNLFAFLFLCVWFLFVRDEFSEEKAWWSLAVILLFPTSFFLAALYTESVFLFCLISSFYAARKGRWWWSAFFAICTTAARITGVFLIPALLVEYWLQYREHKHKKTDQHAAQPVWLPVVLILSGLLGLGSFMLFLWKEFGDPVYFSTVQAEFGSGRSTRVVPYPQVAWRSFQILKTVRPFDWKYFTYVHEFVAGTVGLGVILYALKSVRLSYVVFALGAFFLPTLTGNFSSMSRYLLVCFPLFLVLTDFVQKNRIVRVLWLSLSFLLLIINTLLFLQGHWVA